MISFENTQSITFLKNRIIDTVMGKRDKISKLRGVFAGHDHLFVVAKVHLGCTIPRLGEHLQLNE